jgi:hypothetical protein
MQMEMQPTLTLPNIPWGGELYASAAAGGIEVRFSIDFSIHPPRR